jgi:hypothetical protein
MRMLGEGAGDSTNIAGSLRFSTISFIPPLTLLFYDEDKKFAIKSVFWRNGR